MTGIWADREYLTPVVTPRTQNYKSNTVFWFLLNLSNVFSTGLIKSNDKTMQGRTSLQMASHWSPKENALSLPSWPGPRVCTATHVRLAVAAISRSVKNELFPLESHITSLCSHFHVLRKIEARGRRNMT